MKRILLIAFTTVAALCINAAEKPRVLISTDIDGTAFYGKFQTYYAI